MSKERDIDGMISTAMVGDGDRLLDICAALLAEIKDLRSRVKLLEEKAANT